MSTAAVRNHRVESSPVPRVLPIQESSVGMFRVSQSDSGDRWRWLLLGVGKADSFSSAPPGNLLCLSHGERRSRDYIASAWTQVAPEVG